MVVLTVIKLKTMVVLVVEVVMGKLLEVQEFQVKDIMVDKLLVVTKVVAEAEKVA